MTNQKIGDTAAIVQASGLQLLPVMFVLDLTMNPITDEAIALVTRRIVAEVDPEEIILFGSYAWGTPNKYSDLDLFIIMPDGIPGFNEIEWGVRASRCLRGLMLDVDIWVTTRSAVEEYRAVRGSLERKIVEEGKVLYGQGQTQTGAVMGR